MVKKKVKPYIFNCLSFMYCSDIDNLLRTKREINPLRYEKSSESLKQMLDLGGLPEVNIRHIPFCFMQGYEKYVVNMHQIHFDKYEWDYLVMDFLRNGLLGGIYHIIYGSILEKDKIRLLKQGLDKALHKTIINFIDNQSFIKLVQCRRCKYERICSGPYKGYVAEHGSDGIVPVKGSKIQNPVEFLRR